MSLVIHFPSGNTLTVDLDDDSHMEERFHNMEFQSMTAFKFSLRLIVRSEANYHHLLKQVYEHIKEHHIT